MGNLLDKLFKEKLTKREIEFDPQNWEAMEAVLDGQSGTPTGKNKSNSIPPYLRYLFGIIAIAIIGYGLNLSYQSNQKNSEASKERAKVLQKSYAEQHAQEKTRQLSNTEAESNQSTQTIKDTEFEVNRNESSIARTQSESVQTHAIVQTSGTEDNQRSTINLNDRDDTNYNRSDAHENISSQSTATFTGSSERSVTSSQTEIKTSSEAGSISIAKTQSTKIKETSVATQLMASMAYLNELEINEFGFEREMPQVSWVKMEQKVQKVIKSARRPGMGIYAAYELIEGGSAYSVGLFKEFSIGKQWALSIEPGYNKYQMNGDSISREVSEFFSFGTEPYEQVIIADEMHNVQMPIAIQRHFGKLAIGSGLTYEHVIAMRANKITKIDGVQTEDEQIWLDPVFYQSSLLRARLSMQYDFTQRIHAGINYELPISPRSSFNNIYSLGFVLKYSI